MFPYAIVPVILLVIAALIWTWWTSRQERDPASSVDSFSRALTAMQPGSEPSEGRRRPTGSVSVDGAVPTDVDVAAAEAEAEPQADDGEDR